MNDDQLFRLVLLPGFVIVLPIGIYHRLRSAASKDKLDRRQEGWFILLTLRPLGMLTMLGLIAFMINPEWMSWSSLPLPRWLRWVGVGFGVLAAVLMTWTFRHLGKNLTDTVVTRTEHTLVTTGPYRWVRHPFYVFVFLAMIANSLTTANWLLACLGTTTLLLLVLRTRTEEEKLIERFGDDYRRYMDRTGRFWPRLPRRLAGASG